jgi:hypothetical protein
MKFLPGDSLVAITSETSKSIILVDVRSGALIKRIPTNGRATHMLGISARGDRIAAGNIADNTISVVSLTSADEPKVIPVARQPEGIAITPDGNFAWVGSNRDSIVLVVDTRSGVAIDTLRGFGLPYRLAVSPDGRGAVVTDPMKATIRAFDTNTRRERFAIDVRQPRGHGRRARLAVSRGRGDIARQQVGVCDPAGPQPCRDHRLGAWQDHRLRANRNMVGRDRLLDARRQEIVSHDGDAIPSRRGSPRNLRTVLPDASAPRLRRR